MMRGNRMVEESWLMFSGELAVLKAHHLLEHPNGYYPYGTLQHIPQILPHLDRHGLDLYELVNGKSILDLGAGDGDLSFFFERLGASRVVAVDSPLFNNNGLEGFHTLRTQLQSIVELVDADAHDVDPAGLAPFDLAWCFGFLYHAQEPFFMLRKLASMTNRLLLHTKVFDHPLPVAYFYADRECNNDSTNWWCPSMKALPRMVERAGFHVEWMERIDHHIGQAEPVDLRFDGRALLYATR